MVTLLWNKLYVGTFPANKIGGSFFFISLTVGTSRLIKPQIDLPRLLFGVGLKKKFIVTPQIITFSLKYADNVRG